jgi:hypothetical protein
MILIEASFHLRCSRPAAGSRGSALQVDPSPASRAESIGGLFNEIAGASLWALGSGLIFVNRRWVHLVFTEVKASVD